MEKQEKEIPLGFEQYIKNENPKMVEILADGKRFGLADKRDFLFKYLKCGEIWDVTINLTGRGNKVPKKKWQCPRGCKEKDL